MEAPKSDATSGDNLVQVCTVLNAIEGQILVDLLESGGIDAMFHSSGLSGYGMISASRDGGAGEVLVHARDLAEARNFVTMWQTPLLEEFDGAGGKDPEPERQG